MNENNNNQDILNRLAALEDWKRKKEAQQISFPIDPVSIDILNKYFVRVVGNYTYFAGVGGNPFQTFVATQDGRFFDLAGAWAQYTAEPSTDILSVLNKTIDNQFFDDNQVNLYSTDTAPGGLIAGLGDTYYVVSAASDGYTFKLSSTLGGTPINITSQGVGKQFIVRI